MKILLLLNKSFLSICGYIASNVLRVKLPRNTEGSRSTDTPPLNAKQALYLQEYGQLHVQLNNK